LGVVDSVELGSLLLVWVIVVVNPAPVVLERVSDVPMMLDSFLKANAASD